MEKNKLNIARKLATLEPEIINFCLQELSIQPNEKMHQVCLAIYLTNAFILRIGNSARTSSCESTGCTQLKKKHLTLYETLDAQCNVVGLQFIG